MRILRYAALIAVIVSVAIEGTAFAGSDHTIDATPTLHFVDTVSNSSVTHATQGQTFQWTNTGTIMAGDPDHTSTSDLTGLWDTSFIIPGQTATIPPIDTAGTFAYHCNVHPSMHGQILIPVIAPTTGSKNVAFTVTWATGTIPAGFNADIQVNKPVRRGRKRHWVAFLSDRTGSQVSGDFTPTRGGVFKFRARLQDTSGDASSYSPVASVSVS
jgi:plastocyanin